MDFKKIAAAVDLGPDTETILAYAAWLAATAGAGASATLLHVMDYALTPPAYLQPYIAEEKKRSEAQLEQWAETLRKSGVSAESEIALGRLVDTFGFYLREKGIDVLVTGFKSHLIRPSSSERLIKSLKQAMLVVRGAKARNARIGSVTIKRILCPVDFSETSVRALDSARALAKGNSLEVFALHVVSDPYLRPDRSEWHDEGEKERYLKDITAGAEERLSCLLQTRSEARKIVKFGDPFEVIGKTAEEMDIDLIAIGARGLTPYEGVLLGSISETILKTSPCPVLIVH